MASHMPVNHPLRPLYRALSFVSGALLLIFGLVGFLASQGDPLTKAGDATALGLSTNPASAYVSLILGALVVLSLVIGRNVDTTVVSVVSVVMFLIGSAELFLIRTAESNYLNFTLITCIAFYLVGAVLFTASLYLRRGTAEQAHHSRLAMLGEPTYPELANAQLEH